MSIDDVAFDEVQAQNRHTIVLMQPISNRATRTFMDFHSVSSAMDGICGLYEKKLKDLNPQLRNITYDVADLYKFVDSLTDLSALVFDPTLNAYIPYDRQWIKQRAYQHLNGLLDNLALRIKKLSEFNEEAMELLISSFKFLISRRVLGMPLRLTECKHF